MSRLTYPNVRARSLFALGCVLAVGLLAGPAEVYLRHFPPKDLCPYLCEASPVRGIYKPDDDFCVAYRSWEAFRDDNADRLRAFEPFESLSAGPPLWAFFGNSFVQAPGMLADQTRNNVSDRRIFNLGRNEPLCIRLAQIKLLLEHGLEPERLFVALMPVDVAGLGEQPLATYHVTARGALTYRPLLPRGALGWLVSHSRVVLTAWLRTGRQRGNPHFNKNTIYQGVDEILLGDLRLLFGKLARITQQQHIPVTILLIPAYHQIRFGASCGFQDTLGALFREQGFDVFDPCDVFRSQPDLDALFVPDRHFSPLGNQVLLTELLAHLRAKTAGAGMEAAKR